MLGHSHFASRKISAPIVPKLSYRNSPSKTLLTNSQPKLDEHKLISNPHYKKIEEAYITPPRSRPTASPTPNKRLSVRTYSASTKTSHRTTTNTVISTETTPKKRVISREFLKTTTTPKKLKMVGMNLKEVLKSYEKVPNPSKNSSRGKIIPPEYRSSVESFADKNDKYNHLGCDSVFQSSLRVENWREMVQEIKSGRKPMDYSIEFEKYRAMSPKEYLDTIAQESKLLKPNNKYKMYSQNQPQQSFLIRQPSPSPIKTRKRDSDPSLLLNKSPTRVQTEHNLNESRSTSVRPGSASSQRPENMRDQLIQIDVPKRPNSRPSSVSRPNLSRKNSRRAEEIDNKLLLESPKSEREPYVISRTRIRTPDKMDFRANYNDSHHFEKAKEYSKESEVMKQSLHQEIDELTEKIKAQLAKPSYKRDA